MKIGIIRFPGTLAGAKPLADLVSIISSFANDIYLISGNESTGLLPKSEDIEVSRVDHISRKGFISSALGFILTQFRLARRIRKRSDIKLYVFFFDGSLLIPLLFGKLLSKKIVSIYTGSFLLSQKDTNKLYEKIFRFLMEASFKLSDKIVLYSSSIVEEWALEKYEDKIEVANRHIIDFYRFKIDTTYEKRENKVGFIGRLSPEKNVMGFLRSIPIVNKERNLHFIIGGDGDQKEEMLRYIKDHDLSEFVDYKGWIPHDELPSLLNTLRLLVIPSHTEGLPNLMLEAMACGTPVLVSNVGSIPDVIEDGKNGFILDDNSPECIAEDMKRILEYEDMNEVIKQAHSTVKNRFNYKRAVKDYKRIIDDVQATRSEESSQ